MKHEIARDLPTDDGGVIGSCARIIRVDRC